MKPIERPNFSQAIADEVREMIWSGELAAGTALNEAVLAAKLGVSRTPLREALSRLIAEKAIVQIARRGFFVRELSPDEAIEIYALRPLLEPHALQLAGVPSPHALDVLSTLNDRMASSADAAAAVDLDNAWHAALVESCANQTLLDILQTFVRRTRCYELAFMRDRAHVEEAVRMHEAILESLRTGNLAMACEQLTQNLTSTPIVEQVRIHG